MRPTSFAIASTALFTMIAGCTESPTKAPSNTATIAETSAVKVIAPKTTMASVPMVSFPATAAIDAEPIQEGALQISGELADVCNLHASPSKQHFATNEDTLQPAERDMLAQLAKCLSEGTLMNRGLELVGRTDPRGEPEYNMALGEHRASRVAGYLEGAGVGRKRIRLTTRGELDSQGKDESGWQEDRRVDIALAPSK